jgi:hypothetical protein
MAGINSINVWWNLAVKHFVLSFSLLRGFWFGFIFFEGAGV